MMVELDHNIMLYYLSVLIFHLAVYYHIKGSGTESGAQYFLVALFANNDNKETNSEELN